MYSVQKLHILTYAFMYMCVLYTEDLHKYANTQRQILSCPLALAGVKMLQ